MKKILNKYCFTLMILILSLILLIAGLLDQSNLVMYFSIVCTFWVLTTFVADFVVNFQIKQEMKLKRYKRMWLLLKEDGGYLTDKQGEYGTRLSNVMERMEKTTSDD